MKLAAGLHKDSDGRMFEAITFTNGITDYEYSDVLHRINFIADQYGLNILLYKDYSKARVIYKATK